MHNTYVIGDVHGCYNTLLKLVKKLPQNAKLIFVGDLCDKGNFSKEVIEFVIHNNHTCVYGNHEYLFYNHVRDATVRNIHKIWSKNDAYGGMRTVNNYKYETDLLEKHLKWVETLPWYLEIKVDEKLYFITHGFGLPFYKRKDIEKYKKALLVNRVDDTLYNEHYEDYTKYNMINIFGHCKFDEVLVGDNYYGIDTGCVYGGKLTAIQLGNMKIYSQDLVEKDVANV